MKKILLLATLTFSLHFCANAQQTYAVEDFSDKYYAKLYVYQNDSDDYEGWVAVYNKETNKQLAKVEIDRLYFDLNDDGNVKANVMELPYGEQSVLIHDDFNFDGEKDFALMNGQNSCYGGPSFDIYLYYNGKLTYSSNFSELSNSYCGMFDYSAKEERIYTMVKSGCCWHQYSEYTVENNEPKAIRITTYDHWTKPPYSLTVTEQTWDGEAMVEKVIGKEINLSSLGENDLIPFSFQLENGKWVLFVDHMSAEEDRASTRYTFTNEEGAVELEYPSPDENRKFASFVYTEDGKNYTCSFSNGNARYTVYDYSAPSRKLGVKVTVKGKTYDLKGKPETATRSLRVIAECDNVSEVRK